MGLEQHLKENGLSTKAFDKISDDIRSGDTNVDILVKFDETELSLVCDQYNFTIWQKKAFIEAIKLLPNSKANDNDEKENGNVNPNINQNFKQKEFVYVSSQEQNLWQEMKRLTSMLSEFKTTCLKVKTKNKLCIESSILALEKFGNQIKQHVDNSIGKLIKQVVFFNFVLCKPMVV